MGAKRDYVAEIEARRSRLRRRGSRWEQMTKRLDLLIEISDFAQSSRDKSIEFRRELAKYLPIGFIACVEGYFRLVFRDLIDHGDPFRANAAALRDIRVGLEHVVAMNRGSLTLGEFVSHLLPTNGLDDLNASMSALIGESFLDRLKATKAEYFSQKSTSLQEEDLVGSILQDVESLFEQRHIYAHELAPRSVVDIRRIIGYSSSGLIFMFGTETLVENLIGAT